MDPEASVQETKKKESQKGKASYEGPQGELIMGQKKVIRPGAKGGTMEEKKVRKRGRERGRGWVETIH